MGLLFQGEGACFFADLILTSTETFCLKMRLNDLFQVWHAPDQGGHIMEGPTAPLNPSLGEDNRCFYNEPDQGYSPPGPRGINVP